MGNGNDELTALSPDELDDIIASDSANSEVRGAAVALRQQGLVTDVNQILTAMEGDNAALQASIKNLTAIQAFLRDRDGWGDVAAKVNAIVTRATSVAGAAAEAVVSLADQEPDREIPSPGAEVADAATSTPSADTTDDSGTGDGPSVAKMIDDILRREGGFVNDPDDDGGPTNFGVTQATLARWRGEDVSVDDVKNMKIDEARQIYRKNYFEKPKLDTLPARLQPAMFDMAINHGSGGAITLLQRTLEAQDFPCTVDGGMGPNTRTCSEDAISQQADTFINHLVDARVAFYKDIVARKPEKQKFLNGWLRRAEEFRVA